MAQRSHVPKFGNWESEENVPYTVYFDKARKGRTGGKVINPNDPQENPDILANIMPPSQASPSRSRTEPEEPIRREAAKPRRGSGESGEFRQSSDSPAHNDNMGRRGTGDSAHQRHGGRGSSSGQPQRRSTDYSVDRSPLHPHYQAKIVAKGSASPAASEGKNSYDSSQGAPGRTRMRAANRGDETPDRGAAVPKFGEWDENNPSCADGYTHIFNKVREERHGGAGNSVSNEPSYTPIRRKTPDAGTKACPLILYNKLLYLFFHIIRHAPLFLSSFFFRFPLFRSAAFHGLESKAFEFLDICCESHRDLYIALKALPTQGYLSLFLAGVSLMLR